MTLQGANIDFHEKPVFAMAFQVVQYETGLVGKCSIGMPGQKNILTVHFS